MKKLVLVDTISQHRIRFVVEVEDDIDHALDEIVCEEGNLDFKEFSQEHLGQVIVSHREISREEYLVIFDKDNDYLTQWTEEQKFKFVNKINYGDENDNTDLCNKA
jgi:hypothetical protein